SAAPASDPRAGRMDFSEVEAATTVDFLPQAAKKASAQVESRSGPRRRRAPAPVAPAEDRRPRRPQSAPPPAASGRSRSRAPAEKAEPSAQNRGSRLTLPQPGNASKGRKETTAPTIAPQPDTLGFSSESLVERLNEGPAAPSAGGGPAEYRELYITIAVVVGLFIAVAIYQLTRPEAPPKLETFEPAPVAEPVSEPPPPVAQPAPVPRPSAPSAPERAPEKRTATPMLSVVSTPPRAIVDIDGVVYGRTPLIMPSPRNAASLQITLKLPGHKNHSERLTRNDAGHFSMNVKLQPTSSR
ncbi:MAG: PEGA domain-containing protein, partial [Myxococcota bacterium]